LANLSVSSFSGISWCPGIYIKWLYFLLTPWSRVLLEKLTGL
jgi:hypothetical protein